MRSLLALLVVVLASGTAHARPGEKWGGYVSEGFGGSAYHGAFADYGGGAPRIQLGFGIVRGPWALEWMVAGLIGDGLAIDCYGDECNGTSTPSLLVTGLEARHAWPLVRSRFQWLTLDFVLHGGPHIITPDHGRGALGLGGGAAIDLNASAVSMFLDFSTDYIVVDTQSGSSLGSLPTIVLGMRMGWM